MHIPLGSVRFASTLFIRIIVRDELRAAALMKNEG